MNGPGDGLYLIARIAGRTVAICADRVDCAVDLGTVTPAPRAARGIVGLAALRSRVVTVVDPRAVLQLDIAESVGSRAVVCRIDGHAYALLVEALEDVGEYATTPLPAGVGPDVHWSGAGIALLDRPGEPVLVIDLERLIPAAAALAA